MARKTTQNAVEWVVFAERESGYNSIVRSGFTTAKAAAAARREIERNMDDADTTNHLILTRETANKELARQE